MIRKIVFLTTFCVLILFGGTAFAAGDYLIRTWGYGDLMYNMLNAVKWFMGTEVFNRSVQFAMLVYLLIVGVSCISDKGFNPFSLGMKLVFVIAMQVLLVSSPHNAWIYDETTGDPARQVTNIPAIVGLPLDIISNLEYSMSKAMKESLAATPGGITAGNSLTIPIATALSMMQGVSSYRIGDPFFIRTMQSFTERCIMPDILSGYADIYDIGTSTNFWTAWNDTHPARIASIFKKGDNAGIDGDLKTCPEVYTYLNNQLSAFTAVGGKAWDQLSSSMGMAAGDYVSKNIGAISQYTFGYQQNAQALLTDAISMNLFNDSYMQIASSAGLDAGALSYGMARSQEMARMNSTMSAIMAKKYLPMAKGYLMVIVVALIPIICIVAIATGYIQKPIAMVFGLFVALALWGIGDQLLDFIVTVRTSSYLGMTGGQFNLLTQPVIEQAMLDSLNMSLSMYWMIPTLAFAVSSMSGYAMNSVMGGMGSSVMSGVSGAANEAVTGSRSMGVVRENMINTNKFDSAMNTSYGRSNSYKDLATSDTGVKNDYNMTNTSKFADENMNWRTDNNKRFGEGIDNNGNSIKVEQDKGADGNWQNKEVKTTYRNGVDIDGGRGEKIHLAAGATSLQNADGSTSYEGVSSKMGKVSASYGADGGGMVSTESGHNYSFKHNTVKEDTNRDVTDVSKDYRGDVMINGQKGSGSIKLAGKQGEMAVFEGELGGKQVSMMMDNVAMGITRNGEHDSLAKLNGNVVRSNAETGTTDKSLNEQTKQGETFMYSGADGAVAVNGNLTKNGDKASLDGVNAKDGGVHKVDFDNAKMLKGDDLNKEMTTLKETIANRNEQAAGVASFGMPVKPEFHKQTAQMQQELNAMGAAEAMGATYVKGDIALQKAESGDTATTHLGAKNITGGVDAKGYTVANAMLGAGLSSTVTDTAESKTFINAASNYYDSIMKREGADSLSEQQQLLVKGAVGAEAKFGADIFGNSMTVKANVDANINAALGHDSKSTDTGSINRIMVQGIYDGLEADKQNGFFNNSQGQFDSSKYDATAVERYGKYEDFLSNELMRQNYGPGNLNKDIINGVADVGTSAINYGAGKIDEIKSKF